MMKGVGVVLSPCLALSMALGLATACSPSPAPTPATVAARPAPAPPRAPVAVPLEDRPVLGKVGDTTCASAENELPLGINDIACLSLLKSTIKIETDALNSDLILARVRAALLQPGPVIDGKTAGWVLFATRTHCPTKEVNVMGNVIYTPEGVEISRATPFGGRLALPEGIAMKTLLKEICR